MDMGKNGTLYDTKSGICLHCHRNFIVSSCIYHLSKQCRNEDRESWNHTYIYSCICFCWHADTEVRSVKKEGFMGICSRNVILYDLDFDLMDFSKKISFCFPQKGSQHVSYVLQEEL